MKPWERRLNDLAHLLRSCAATYFEPDLFRRNVNQFLQTSRTVTFIIQKNKTSIPDYKNWYDAHVVESWASDVVMQWAKESRNVVEKEGDLDLNSSLTVTLLFSYLSETDVQIECGRTELLNASVKKLIRMAQSRLPTGVADAAAVKIERRWVTASLPSWELLHALSYVYGRVFLCCQRLAQHLGEALDRDIPDASDFDWLRGRARQVRYVKVRDRKTHAVETETVGVDRKFKPPEGIQSALDALKTTPRPPSALDDVAHVFATLAKATFEHYGNHLPMLLLFDEQWRLVDFLSTQFADQTDKFVFWRTVADRIATLRAHGLVWIAESWVRETSRRDLSPVRDMPIVGEHLHVFGLDRLGNTKHVAWRILRATKDDKPTLESISEGNDQFLRTTPFYLVPAMRAMGLPDPPELKT